MIGANQPLKIYTATAGGRDAEGRKINTYALTATVIGNLFERTSREMTEGTWTVIGDHLALLPAATAVTHKDVIEDTDGVRYRVEAVRRRRSPSGAVHHVSCLLVRTEP